MSDVLVIPPETERQQGLASHPESSAWVSANAGSGKTFVLAQRVVRLLLKGTDPSRILCLTFTKAAAGEMANRVFEILGEWTVLGDEGLRKRLTKIEGAPVKDAQLLHARTLFARALETPGGLKIQTIHAFCEALLHQFPIEANIPGNFSVMEDMAKKRLMDQARREVVLEIAGGENPELSQAFSEMMDHAGDAAIEKVIGEIVSRRESLSAWLAEIGGPENARLVARPELGFSDTDSVESESAKLVDQSLLSIEDWKSLRFYANDDGGKNSIALAELVSGFLEATNVDNKLTFLRQVLFTSAGGIRSFSKYPAKSVAEAMPDIRERLEAEAHRIEEATLRLNTLIQIERTKPLLLFAQAMLLKYVKLKRSGGLLDFDDLVSRTVDLLQRKEARMWVLYKLDRGIDHILLDEAQDTSPQQWQIVNELVEEFFAGSGSRPANRTMFAVGDEKQSIYSFQGAKPQAFSEQYRALGAKAQQAEKPFPRASLNLSFRSTPQVLAAVDEVFNNPFNAKGLVYGGDYQDHIAHRRLDWGTVEVWDKLESLTVEDPDVWHEPADPLNNPHQAIRLAKHVADRIADWVASKSLIKVKDKVRPVNEGDFVVLVRSRDRFVPALTRALKDRGVAVAGADRLSLIDHIAVQDLIALGNVAVTPKDDLSLAALLKSPLFGLSEEHLLDLAYGRSGSLYDELRSRNEEAHLAPMWEKLERWRNRAGTMPVYEFYARVLGDDRGRHDFYSRLGREAEDVLDAFLALTLDHENVGLPGLHAFLESLRAEAPEIKREFTDDQHEVRIMTVHAAKGLEAPIVFVVDKGSQVVSNQHHNALFEWGDEYADAGQRGFLWVPSSKDHGDRSQSAKQYMIEQAEEEYRRLLYVAMTRACDHLIICGYRSGKTKPTPNWHDMVKEALLPELSQGDVLEDNVFVRLWRAQPPENQLVANSAQTIAAKTHALPGWLHHHLPRERNLPRPLNPSGAQALIDESLAQDKTIESLLVEKAQMSGELARRRGTAIHKLLQVVPEIPAADKWNKAQTYLSATLPELSEQQHAATLTAVQNTLTSSELEAYFDPATSRAEVPLMGRIELAGGPRSVSGTVDRMAVLSDRVVLLDYKTSLRVPGGIDDLAPDYVMQMALYRALVQRLYPKLPVETYLIWTHASEGPRVMKLPDAALDAAYGSLSSL